MSIQPSLKTVLKRLRLSGILPTLPDRIAYANKTKLPYQDLLELVLQDEIDRREHNGLNKNEASKRPFFCGADLRKF